MTSFYHQKDNSFLRSKINFNDIVRSTLSQSARIQTRVVPDLELIALTRPDRGFFFALLIISVPKLSDYA